MWNKMWIRGLVLVLAVAGFSSFRCGVGEQPRRSLARRDAAKSLFIINQSPTGDQCQSLSSEAILRLAKERKENDSIYLDPQTGLRSFNARLVGIFSCMDSDSQQANDLTLDFRLAKPVIELATRDASSMYPQIKFNVTYRTAADICRHQQAAGHAADEYYVNGANFFLGPGCSESMASVGQLASYWNVPMCSSGYLPKLVTARFKPLTLMQLSLSIDSVGELLLELFQRYKWRHLVMVTDEKHPLHPLIRDGLLEFFHTMYMAAPGQQTGGEGGTRNAGSGSPQQSDHTRSTSHKWAGEEPQPPGSSNSNNNNNNRREPYYINITTRNFAYSSNRKPADYERVMLEAASYSRIMLLLARNSTIDHLLKAAHAQGMSRGQFVFIAHELFETRAFASTGTGGAQSGSMHPPTRASTNSDWLLDDKIEIDNSTSGELVREIFQPLLTLSLRIPTTERLASFRSEVANLSEREFNYRIEPASLKSQYSLGVAAFIYDCVMLYANKVNFILNSTHMHRIDGQNIFKLAADHTFSGALTGDLKINSAGQRVMDFTLNDFSPLSLKLEPIAHFSAMERRLSFLPGRQPHWALRNQSAPRSEPKCRHSDHYCGKYAWSSFGWASGAGAGGEAEPEGQQQSAVDRFVVGVWLVVGLVGTVALSSSSIGWLVYRRFRIESELLNLWWSIKYEDILFEEPNGGAEIMCCADGKRSMSSLAISNESLGGAPAPQPPPLKAQQPALAQASQAGPPQPPPPQPDSLAVVSGGGGGGLSGLHSGSQLSVALAGSPAAQQPAPEVGAPSKRSERQPAASSVGAAKLIPLINKQAAAAAASRSPKSNSANLQAPQKSSTGASSKPPPTTTQPVAGKSQPEANNNNNKDPSISSQNKNAKMRLGTVLSGSRSAAAAASPAAHTTKVGLYKASRVAVKHLNVKGLNINRQLLIELRQVRDLTHENLIKFIGLCPEEPNVALVSELCTRGNLQDLLQNDSIRLDWSFRYSIISDIVEGLVHLHSSPIQYHGRLKSSNCVIDNRFVVKLTDFGLPTLLSAVEHSAEDDASAAPINPRLLLWTAPEHLRTKRPLLSGSQKGDIYSLAIIFQEIITRCGPFECEPILCGASAAAPSLAPQLIRTPAPDVSTTHHKQHLLPVAPAAAAAYQTTPLVVQHKQRLEPEEIVNLVRMGLQPAFRPYFRPDVALAASAGSAAPDFNVSELIALVQSCWQESAALRPGMASVRQQIRKMRHAGHLGGANLMDNLLQRMERYTDNLESLVEQKTAELMEEKKRSEELLYEMLPRFVVDQLKYGHSVTPEAYEAVTISFSDIKDFTSIAARSAPIEVVNLLNQLYTEFDDCIARYDVYKVETIGDAYMVVSGLPVRNGHQHAAEIADMSLALLELIDNFEIAHLPQVKLELRIGIHSGPCASGVVGTRMFRYCLFGDTVNTASRMESHGEPMKIHLSEDSALILHQFPQFLVEPRGLVDIKGKGLMNTYWLVGKRAALEL